MILTKLQMYGAVAGALVLAAFALFFGGKQVAKNEIALAVAKATAKAITKRAEINGEIDEDSDLLNRARNSGVVRKTD